MALRLTDLPASWGSRGQVERLTPDAAASLSRVLARAVADSGTNFQLNDAYRSKAEQIGLFKANYSNTGRKYKRDPGDRWYGGTVWARRADSVAVASPDLYGTGTGANHTRGVAVDIVPAGIQGYLQREGLRSGWSWSEGRKNNEAWHFVYEPSRDHYRSEGTLDHAAVQKVVGATVDGKIGTGTVAKIKAWQKQHGLTADGKVGATTKRAMGLSGSAPTPPKPARKPETVAAVASYKLDQSPSPNCYGDRKGHKVNSITIHWWGKPVGQKRDGIISWLVNPKAQVSAHYVVTKGHVTQLVEEACGSWANGNKTANLESITIECDPNDPVGTLPTVAALIADIRGRHGDLPIYPHQHWTATECPGAYLDLLPALDAMARGGSANLGRPVVTPSKPKNVTVDGRFGTNTVKALQRYLVKLHGAKLAIDGKAGHSTWKALQRALGTPVDGVVSNQSYKASELGNGITQGWDYDGRGAKGSTMVRKLQSWVGVKADGVWGEKTSKALQVKLNTYDLG